MSLGPTIVMDSRSLVVSSSRTLVGMRNSKTLRDHLLINLRDFDRNRVPYLLQEEIRKEVQKGLTEDIWANGYSSAMGKGLPRLAFQRWEIDASIKGSTYLWAYTNVDFHAGRIEQEYRDDLARTSTLVSELYHGLRYADGSAVQTPEVMLVGTEYSAHVFLGIKGFCEEQK